jgi:hypothetical protein
LDIHLDVDLAICLWLNHPFGHGDVNAHQNARSSMYELFNEQDLNESRVSGNSQTRGGRGFHCLPRKSTTTIAGDRRSGTGNSRSDLKPYQATVLPAVLPICGIYALATSPPGRVLEQPEAAC